MGNPKLAKFPSPPKKSPLPDSEREAPPLPTARSVIGDPLQVGFTIVGVTALFGAVGWWLDTRLHTFPICFFLGAVLGLFGIIYSFVLRLREQERASSQKP